MRGKWEDLPLPAPKRKPLERIVVPGIEWECQRCGERYFDNHVCKAEAEEDG